MRMRVLVVSTQSRVRSTALRQPAYPASRWSSLQCGVQRRTRASWRELVGVLPEPGRQTRSVCGAERGRLGHHRRLTWTPRTSAWICMHRSFAVTPPSTLRHLQPHPASPRHRVGDVAGLVADRLERRPGQVRGGVEPRQPDDGAAGVGPPVGREQAGERRDEVDAAVVLDLRGRASRRRRRRDEPELVAQPLDGRPGDGDRALQRVHRLGVAELVGDRRQQAVRCGRAPRRC